jgi:hypothetical protein
MSPASKQSTLWTQARVATVVLVASLGLWGCARKPAASSDRVRVLESRCVKLEQDYRTVQQAHDKAKKELASLEEEAARVQKDLASHDALVKERDELRKQTKAAETEREQLRQALVQRTNERDELRQQIAVRITERDVLQGRCERLRKGLQTLMSQDDTPLGAATPESGPATPTAGGPTTSGASVGGQS